MARTLTKKQKGFVKDFIKTGNGTQAALQNYDTKNRRVAQTIASENLSKPIIVKTLQEQLPDELLAKVHLEGLQAKAFRFSPEGEMIQVDDFATRHKYLDSAYKLRGDFAPEKHIVIQKKLIKFDV